MSTELQTIERTEIVDWQMYEVPAIVKEQVGKMVRKSIYDITEQELEDFIQYCACMKLNPLEKDVYPVPYTDKQSGKRTIQYITSINKMLDRAHSSGEFTGIESEPIFDKNGKLSGAKATAYRNGNAFTAQVKLTEYSSGKGLWHPQYGKPETMICKVARSHALTLAFPKETKNMYTVEEFEQVLDRKDPERSIQARLRSAPKLDIIPTEVDSGFFEEQYREIEKIKTEIMNIAKKLEMSEKDIASQFQDKLKLYKKFENDGEFDRAKGVYLNILAVISDTLENKEVLVEK